MLVMALATVWQCRTAFHAVSIPLPWAEVFRLRGIKEPGHTNRSDAPAHWVWSNWSASTWVACWGTRRRMRCPCRASFVRLQLRFCFWQARSQSCICAAVLQRALHYARIQRMRRENKVNL